MDETEAELERYVRQFLYEFKALILERGLFMKDRVKNKESLVDLGLTKKQREEIILDLSVLDYSAGPIKDELKAGDMWVFGKHIEGVEIYIKLKLAGPPGNEYPICLSFHKSERQLNYPFKR
jgi:hypothetical protein